MTTVFVHATKDDAGRLTFYLDVPHESPTVRGYATILQTGLSGLTLPAVLAVPTEFYLGMGLQQVLSGQRLTGIGAILAYMKRVGGGVRRQGSKVERGCRVYVRLALRGGAAKQTAGV